MGRREAGAWVFGASLLCQGFKGLRLFRLARLRWVRHRAYHGDGVNIVFQAVVGFVLDFAGCGLLLHASGKATALNHEARNDAVKYGAVVMLFFDVFQKVGHGNGGFFCVELKRDGAEFGNVQGNFGCAHVSVSIH